MPAGGLGNCCQVQQYRSARGQGPVDILPHAQKAASDGRYKLVRLSRQQCVSSGPDPLMDWFYGRDSEGELLFDSTDELYRVDMAVPEPTLDRQGTALAAGSSPLDPAALPAPARPAHATLQAELDRRDAVAAYNQRYDRVHCPGDGNRDGVVDQQDLDQWHDLSTRNGGQSSWYDFNHDGRTDALDRAIIEQHLRRRCAAP